MLRRPKFTDGLQGQAFKVRIAEGTCEVCDRPVDSLLIGW